MRSAGSAASPAKPCRSYSSTMRGAQTSCSSTSIPQPRRRRCPASSTERASYLPHGLSYILARVKLATVKMQNSCNSILLQPSGATSAMSTWAVTDTIPTPNPTKSLPRIRMQGPPAAHITSEPSANIM